MATTDQKNLPLLISSQANIFYLTGFSSLVPNIREAHVLMLDKQIILFIDSLYFATARAKTVYPRKINQKQILVLATSNTQPFYQQLQQMIQKHKVSTLGFEPTDLTFLEHEKLQTGLPGTKLIPISDCLCEVRQQKTAWEISQIKSACNLTDKCFKYLLKKLKPEITEIQLAWEIEKYIKSHGAGMAFPPIVAFGSNSSQPHHLPTTLRLGLGKANNIVLLDFGAKVNGYCADMTRTVFLGKPTPLQKRAYKAVAQAQKKALEMLKSGTRSGGRIDKAAKSIISKNGFPPYSHGLGHGIGLDIHESPRLNVKRDEILTPGNIFSVEPAIYLEGKFGIRIEDTVLLKEKGITLLTKSEKNIL